jgi:hypothetical protein
MMKPNYQFEKRQRELEKKKKKAEKADRKTALVDVPPADDAVQGEQLNQPE